MTNAPRVGPLFLDATDELISISARGLAGVALQLLGTWTGTVSFEATVDGNTWVAFNMVPAASATAASSATANGAWSANCAGFEAVRARFSTATSGTVQAIMQGSEAAGRF
jgi:hypothetical protein